MEIMVCTMHINVVTLKHQPKVAQKSKQRACMTVPHN